MSPVSPSQELKGPQMRSPLYRVSRLLLQWRQVARVIFNDLVFITYGSSARRFFGLSRHRGCLHHFYQCRILSPTYLVRAFWPPLRRCMAPRTAPTTVLGIIQCQRAKAPLRGATLKKVHSSRWISAGVGRNECRRFKKPACPRASSRLHVQGAIHGLEWIREP